MAEVNKPGYEFDDIGGSIGTNNPVIDTSKYVFFKDSLTL